MPDAIKTDFKIIPFAYQEIGYVCVKELIRLGADIPFVITHKDSPNEKIWFRSVYRLCRENRIPVYYVEDLSKDELRDRAKKERPDLILSLYYRRLLPKEIFSIPKMGSVNLHGSFLPHYRGRCPVNWAILMGEKFTGLTFHFIVKEPDAGDIIRRERIPIGKTDTALDVYRKMARRAPRLLRRVLADFALGTVRRTRQNKREATYFGGRKPEDGRINWSESARAICNLVRAVAHPYPGAFTFLMSRQKMYVWKSRVFLRRKHTEKMKNFSQGQIVSISKKRGIVTKAGKGFLGCLKVETGNSGRLDGYSLAKRKNIKIGDRLY